MRSELALGLAVTLTCASTSGAPAKKDQLDVSVILDEGLEGKPEAVAAAWTGYALARANWISKHVTLKSFEAKSYSRTLEEEVAGRDALAAIWGELKAEESGLADVYLDALQKVKGAGLLREYVWINLRQPGWISEPKGLKLKRYIDWAKANLQGHVVETHADVRIEKAAAK